MNHISKNKLVVVGSANTDMVIRAPHFPVPGETVIGNDFMTNFGGKGANQAVAAARLGTATSFVGKVGNDDFGHATVAHLKEEGIDVSHLTTSPTLPSGVALITTAAGGENTIVVSSGANNDLSPTDVNNARSLFQSAAIVLMQLETPVNTLVAAASMAKACGCMVMLNPAPAPKEPLPAELLRNVDLLIPNENEASMISGIAVTDNDSAARAIADIQRLGVADVIITVGKRGAVAMIGGRLTVVPAFTVAAVDTTAAGDTFCGALASALIRQMPMQEALAFANRASSISVTRKGAQVSMPRLNEVRESQRV